MVRHCLDRGCEVVGACRAESVGRLAEFDGRMTLVPGRTNEQEVVRRAVAGCDGVLTVLVPWGVNGYASGTAQAVLDHAGPGPASSSPAAGASPETARTATRGSSGGSCPS